MRQAIACVAMIIFAVILLFCVLGLYNISGTIKASENLSGMAEGLVDAGKRTSGTYVEDSAGDEPIVSDGLQKQYNQRTALIVCTAASGIIVVACGIVFFFGDKLSRLSKNKNNTPLPSNAATESMQALKEMFDGGFITQEEYEEKKKDILDKL